MPFLQFTESLAKKGHVSFSPLQWGDLIDWSGPTKALEHGINGQQPLDNAGTGQISPF